MIELPRIDGGFSCIVADPPWHFKTFNDDLVGDRDVRNHYETMPLAEIAAMPVRDIAAADAHLFLWVTGPCLRQAFDVLDGWGFAYSGIAFTWFKLRRWHDTAQISLLPIEAADLAVMMGYTTRKNTEIVLLGRRGSPQRLAADVREVIFEPAREHSRKPDEFFARVERYCPGPRLELFGRQSRSGWAAWGDQATKFDEAAA